MKKFFKNAFSSSSVIYKYTSFLYHIKDKYWQPFHYSNLKNLLSLYSEHNKQVTFIQVGSNDGITNDPLNYFICKYSWKGVCIEPVPENFKNLSKTYFGNSNVRLINAALGKEGNQTIYFINKQKADNLNINLPEWYNQLASFDKELVVCDIQGADKIKIVDELVIESLSFSSLIKKAKMNKFNLLHIDTEGADWMILSSFPFDFNQPDIILFEHNHLALKDYKKAVTTLRNYNYHLLKIGTDTFCYHRNLDSLFKLAVKDSSRIFKT